MANIQLQIYVEIIFGLPVLSRQENPILTDSFFVVLIVCTHM